VQSFLRVPALKAFELRRACMREVRHIILATVFALTGVGVAAATQPRVSDQQLWGLL